MLLWAGVEVREDYCSRREGYKNATLKSKRTKAIINDFILCKVPLAKQAKGANQPSRMYLRISLKLGLLPYISRKVRKTLAASHIAPIIEAVRMVMLSKSSQTGKAPMLSFIIAATGAVREDNMIGVVDEQANED